MLEELKREVCDANLELDRQGLVTLTWGNASGMDRGEGLVVIKPSGVAYVDLTPEAMVVVDLDGAVVEGDYRPSSDTPTHVRLFKAFPDIGGIAHTHSKHAVMFCQAGVEIPCLGTTHADHFYGTVPVARLLTEEEVAADYEGNTGEVIIERFAELDPQAMPAVLLAGHAPFTWGQDVGDAVRNSIALEAVAEMALGTFQAGDTPPLADHILDKHYRRKHGPDAYYGQG
jgi:L-ribulose-5-phosphate 4-epimerase